MIADADRLVYKDIKQKCCMLEKILFPDYEHEAIKKYLSTLGYCYTTRTYKEVGKYKVGELYVAPWGDVLRIDEVRTYQRVRERPFYDEMSKSERAEILRYSENLGLPYEFIKFSRVLLQSVNRVSSLRASIQGGA